MDEIRYKSDFQFLVDILPVQNKSNPSLRCVYLRGGQDIELKECLILQIVYNFDGNGIQIEVDEGAPKFQVNQNWMLSFWYSPRFYLYVNPPASTNDVVCITYVEFLE